MEVNIITYGGIISSLKVPNKSGVSEEVVIGFNNLDQYTKDNPYFGALIGRYGNRIAKGKFSLDGKEFQLATNNGVNALHGGSEGFHRVIWTVEEAKGGDRATLKLKYLSKDMEEGYPGNLTVFVTYTLNNDNSLEVLYEATTDKKTIVNLTQHSYFNLSGDFSKTILKDEITIDADKIAMLIPFSGHCITHMTIRKERGISDKQPIVDEFAPLFHVRAEAPPLILITGDRELEMLGRYEENAYMMRMMKIAGHTKTKLYELDSFDHGGMASPAYEILLDEIKKPL